MGSRRHHGSSLVTPSADEATSTRTEGRVSRALLAALTGAPEGADIRYPPRADVLKLAAIVSLALALRLAVLLTSAWTEPGALMTLRVSENVARGDGFVYNLGERVLGTTTPLYALLLSVFAALGLPALEMGKAVCVLADLALCVVVYAWLRDMGRARAGLVAAFLVAVDARFVHWSISGMETSLVTLLGVRACLAQVQRRYATAAALLAVLFLVRWDSALLAAVLAVAVVVRERRLLLGPPAIAAAIVAPWLAFATWYFGSPIPPTFMAKTVVNGRYETGISSRITDFASAVLGTHYEWALAAAALLGLLVFVVGRVRGLRPAVAWLGLYWIACLASKAPINDRYVLPSLPVMLVLAALGLDAVHSFVVATGSRLVPRVLPLAASVAAVGAFLPLLPRLQEGQAFNDGVAVRAAVWVKQRAAPGDRLMVSPSLSPGYFGYYSGLRLIDAKGLLTPVVLPFWGPEHESPAFDIAHALQPEWIILEIGELPSIKGGAPPGVSWDDEWRAVEAFFSPHEARGYLVYRRRRPAREIRAASSGHDTR